jgi:hypothetical protein
MPDEPAKKSALIPASPQEYFLQRLLPWAACQSNVQVPRVHLLSRNEHDSCVAAGTATVVPTNKTVVFSGPEALSTPVRQGVILPEWGETG